MECPQCLENLSKKDQQSLNCSKCGFDLDDDSDFDPNADLLADEFEEDDEFEDEDDWI